MPRGGRTIGRYGVVGSVEAGAMRRVALILLALSTPASAGAVTTFSGVPWQLAQFCLKSCCPLCALIVYEKKKTIPINTLFFAWIFKRFIATIGVECG